MLSVVALMLAYFWEPARTVGSVLCQRALALVTALQRGECCPIRARHHPLLLGSFRTSQRPAFAGPSSPRSPDRALSFWSRLYACLAAGSRRPIHAETDIRPEVVLLWLRAGLRCGSREFHRKDICHLVFGSPLLVILCIYYLQQYRAKAADLALQLLAITASCLAAFNFFLALSARPVATRVGSGSPAQERSHLSLVAEQNEAEVKKSLPTHIAPCTTSV